MAKKQCVDFLKDALPRLGLRWPGFRRVCRQVCKRVGRRLQELHLGDFASYQAYLAANPSEWETLSQLCRVSITRFYRDRLIFDLLGEKILPELAQRAATGRGGPLRLWSAGCASGEEPYTLSLLWHRYVKPAFPDLALEIIATDIDEELLARAAAAAYPPCALRELPRLWLAEYFSCRHERYYLLPRFRENVHFSLQDLKKTLPAGPFHLICCRNLVFTYYAEEAQREFLAEIYDLLISGGVLVIGNKEKLPDSPLALAPIQPGIPVYRKSGFFRKVSNQVPQLFYT